MSSDRDRALLDLAEGQVLQRYRDTIESAARALLERAPNDVDLEDLVQAASLALLKAFRRARTSRRDGGVDEYLRTRIWGSLSDELFRTPGARSRQVRRRLPYPAVDEGNDQAALVEAQQLWDLVAQAIVRLPPAERSVLQLYYLRGATMHEIGTLLGVTESRASQIHNSALARLKTRMRRFAA